MPFKDTITSIGLTCSFAVSWLAELYMHGKSTFQILEQGKMKSVSVTRTEYCLTDEAIEKFKDIHDESSVTTTCYLLYHTTIRCQITIS